MVARASRGEAAAIDAELATILQAAITREGHHGNIKQFTVMGRASWDDYVLRQVLDGYRLVGWRVRLHPKERKEDRPRITFTNMLAAPKKEGEESG
jgi:hypothetical protein